MIQYKEFKLGDVASFKNGRKKSKNEGKYPVYGGNGISDYINDYNVEGNTIVIGRVGAYCGSVFKVKEKCWVSDNAIECKIIEDYDFNYLYYLISSLQLNKRKIGSTQPLITQDILKEIIIRLPPINYQKKVSYFLELLNNKIKINEKINQDLLNISKVLFDFYILNKEKKFSKYKITKFGDLISIQNGYAFKSKDYCDDGCSMIRTKNITSDGFINNDDLIKLPPSFYNNNKYTKYKFKCFDIILVMVGASIGKIGLITEINIPSLQNQICDVLERLIIIFHNLISIFIFI